MKWLRRWERAEGMRRRSATKERHEGFDASISARHKIRLMLKAEPERTSVLRTKGLPTSLGDWRTGRKDPLKPNPPSTRFVKC